MENSFCLCGSRYKINGFFDVLFLVDGLINWPLTGHRSGHVDGDVCQISGCICVDLGCRFRDRRSKRLHCGHFRYNRWYIVVHSLRKQLFNLNSRIGDACSLRLVVGRGEDHSLMVDLQFSYVVGCRDKLRNLE